MRLLIGGFLLFTLLAPVSGCASSCAPDVKIEARGQEIALGRYSGLKVGRAGDSGEEDPFILALRDPDDAGGTLSVIPFGAGEPCELGRVRTYSIPGVPRPDGTTVTNVDARLPFIDESDGSLRFADLDCARHPPALADAAPFIQSIVDHQSQQVTGFLAKNVSNQLYFLDPWNDVSRLIAENVSMWIPYQGQLWLLEQTQLVVRELDGSEVARVGANVSAFFPIWNRGEFVLADGPDLYLLSDLARPPELLEAGACKPYYFSGATDSLGFLSPCDRRRLVVLDLDTNERIQYAENVGSFRDLGWLFYVTGPPGTYSVGELWAVPPGLSPYKVGDNGYMWNIGLLPPDRYLVLLDFQDNRGRLGTWWTDQEFFEIATDVAKFTTMHERITILTESDGVTGTLSVLDPDDFTTDLSVEGVAINGWRFSYYAPALGYIDQYDAENRVGTLNVWVVPTGDRDQVDENVAEFLEIHWPDWGVLYTIGTGDLTGIYFSEVKVE